MNGNVPDFIRFGRAICGDLGQAERREWWLGNGLGAYAAGTVAGTLTRRYHGLLIAPVYPPLGRWLVFAKADATLLDGDREIPLFSNRWGGGAVSPEGHVHLGSFHLHGRMPVWRYALGERVIEQRIWLEPGANTVYVAYRLEEIPLNPPSFAILPYKIPPSPPLQKGGGEAGGLSPPDWIEQLALAADSFLFARPLPDLPDGESVIAGYPWFGDWGRDTMIALPGLTLATGRFDSARRILLTFARFVDQGMLPNVFPGAGETPDYNTVDAGLWYFEAWRAYLEASNDWPVLTEVFPVLADMIDWHVRGTRYRIDMDPADGLIHAGEPGVQLTWMDAKVGDWVVTPRIGKPVEINALWYNALAIMADFAERLGQPPAPYQELAAKVRQGFQRFIRPNGAGLFDVLDSLDGDDPTSRPNQIFAVSLPHSPLDPEIQQTVVRVCGRELLTSYGLRSLAPSHPDYRPYYLGGVWERDGSYHQGPVWAWLLGHYALAEHRVHGDAAVAQARLRPIRDHLLDAGLGTVSEILDGAPPHVPRGAPAQAWSVACVLEAWQRLERLKR